MPPAARATRVTHPQEGYKSMLGKPLKFKITQVGGRAGMGRGPCLGRPQLHCQGRWWLVVGGRCVVGGWQGCPCWMLHLCAWPELPPA